MKVAKIYLSKLNFWNARRKSVYVKNINMFLQETFYNLIPSAFPQDKISNFHIFVWYGA